MAYEEDAEFNKKKKKRTHTPCLNEKFLCFNEA